jgi:hypothetical protein
VILALAMPGLLTGAILVFILGMNAYATPILLGGPRFQMMGPVVYGQFAQPQQLAVRRRAVVRADDGDALAEPRLECPRPAPLPPLTRGPRGRIADSLFKWPFAPGPEG